MDSTILEQVRHLCRDRAAYEHLKAILVQQERVHQLSYEDRYEKLMSVGLLDKSASDTETSTLLSNIIAREKSLAQLADAIQRSPSLELVLQIAVQVAQKLLQVDRIAIFRRYPDGRGEFATDAIAMGLKSLAEMPERQLSLARHMVESMQMENSLQTVDSISSSSFSAHIVNLLEQIDISSYAANKIYAGQEVWGTLVAFHGSAYHSWSESDRTSLSLVSAQVGIAISLTNLRNQSQDLTEDLEALQIELDDLQKVVAEIAASSTNFPIASDTSAIIATTDESIDESIIAPILQNFVEDPHVDSLETDNLQVVESEGNQNLEEIVYSAFQASEVQRVEPRTSLESEALYKLETDDSLPPLPLDQEFPTLLQESEVENEDENLDSGENITSVKFTGADISYVIMPDDLKVINLRVIAESELEIDEIDEVAAIDADQPLEQLLLVDSSTLLPEDFEIELIELVKLETTESAPIELKDSKLNQLAAIDSQFRDPIEGDLIEYNLIEDDSTELDVPAISLIASHSEIIDSQSREDESSNLELELADSDSIPATLESEVELIRERQEAQEIDQFEESDRDCEPAIEPQFIETILAIAGNDEKANNFLLRVIDSYLEDTPQLVQGIEKAIAIKDHVRLMQLLNLLRSSSDYIGALPLSYQCRQLESAVKANYVVLIYASLSKLAIETHRVTEALRIERLLYSQKFLDIKNE